MQQLFRILRCLIEHFGVFEPIYIFGNLGIPIGFSIFETHLVDFWHLFNRLTFFILTPNTITLIPVQRLSHTKNKIYPKIHQSSQKIKQKVNVNHVNPNVYQNDPIMVKQTKIFLQNVRKNEKMCEFTQKFTETIQKCSY